MYLFAILPDSRWFQQHVRTSGASCFLYLTLNNFHSPGATVLFKMGNQASAARWYRAVSRWLCKGNGVKGENRESEEQMWRLVVG